MACTGVSRPRASARFVLPPVVMDAARYGRIFCAFSFCDRGHAFCRNCRKNWSNRWRLEGWRDNGALDGSIALLYLVCTRIADVCAVDLGSRRIELGIPRPLHRPRGSVAFGLF